MQCITILFSSICFAVFFHKALILKKLKQITVIGLGLLGGSITLAVLRSFSRIKTIGFAHRAVTRKKAKELSVAGKIVGDIEKSVKGSDLVILATPISTFEEIFSAISGSLKPGCIVTDVGSTKVLAHRWASKRLGVNVHYVGSHPIAGSEQRGIEFARDDLFDNATCILTKTKRTNRTAAKTLTKFWTEIGCSVKSMSPSVHDKIFASISHLPHVIAAALVNATNADELKSAGKGFIDTSRIASGPANIWTDILVTNSNNTIRGIDKIIAELLRLKKAIKNEDEKEVEKLLSKARDKRATMINYKIKSKELIS